MVSMQQLVKVPEMMATMREMSKEMMKVGELCYKPYEQQEKTCLKR